MNKEMKGLNIVLEVIVAQIERAKLKAEKEGTYKYSDTYDECIKIVEKHKQRYIIPKKKQ